ncbi:MFS transporter [Desulfitobacterium chlororespirans]|uniref:MFS transporter, putative metabolite:H+ symporter n=1 Tax=Desulfitobacterium chlororespirans DSM 11544 TaxID=1121395 RepID=A0A1M7SML9_9FIRM|nr:MFS transporter [Desulfitobacterium chlororespirans]SHN59726.1 MFS transporter, putative metabolite:H+ symporter [Desulfitobacterium chlororespirans DSM 11544]
MTNPVQSGADNRTYFDGHKLSKVQKRFLIIAAFFYVFDQMDVSNFGFAAPSLIAQYGWNMQQITNIGALNMLGMCIGAVIGGWTADIIGRKKSLLLYGFIFSISSLANAVFTDYMAFAFFRTLTGVGTIALVTIAMAYISEMMPSESRGKYQALAIAGGTAGIPLMAILARIVVPMSPDGWRFIFILGGVGIVVCLLGIPWIKESPRWLVSKGRIEEAERVLAEILPEAKLPANVGAADKPKNSGIIEACKVMFSGAYIKRTVGLLFVVTGVTLGNFYLANLYQAVHTTMGFSLNDALTINMVAALVVPIGNLIVSRVTDKGGRKIPIIIWFIVIGGLFIIQGLFSSVLPIAICMVLKGLLMSAAMTLAWTYTAESYPTQVRTSAGGIALGLGRMISAWAMVSASPIFLTYGYFGANLVNGLFFIVPALIFLVLGEKTAGASLEKLNPVHKTQAI